jgi:DNA-binding NarL/FixJ family response regulator
MPSDPVSVIIPGALALRIWELAALEDCVFSDMLTRLIEKSLAEKEEKLARPPADLSPRQIAVLICLRSGLAVKEIADNLKVSETTVRTHIIRIRERTGCTDILKLRIP